MAKVSGGGLYQYLQSVQGYLAPPITAVFFLGLFWKRINSAGATWGLAGGFVLGMIKLTIQAFYGKGKIENPAFLAASATSTSFTLPAFFLPAPILMVVASLLTPPPPEKDQGIDLRFDPPRSGRGNRKSWDLGNKVMVASSCCSLLACTSISASG